MDPSLQNAVTCGIYVFSELNPPLRAPGLNGFDYYPAPNDKIVFPAPDSDVFEDPEAEPFDLCLWPKGGGSYTPEPGDSIVLINPDPPIQPTGPMIYVVSK